MASSSSRSEKGEGDGVRPGAGYAAKSVGRRATFGLIELLDAEHKDWSDQVLSVAADRFERRLTEEIADLRLEFRQTLQDGLTSIRQELATTRVEMLKWSFVFWIGQIAAMLCLVSFMLRNVAR